MKIAKKLLFPVIGLPSILLITILLFLTRVPTFTITAIASVGAVLSIAPYFAFDYVEYQKLKLAEDAYPSFLRDLTQAINSGMTIPQAITTVKETNYGELTKYIERLHTWLSWDIPFPKAWKLFTNKLKRSGMIQRINGIILESFFAGGDIGAILSSLSEDVDTIKKMEADKRAAMMQHLTVMYVVFMVFLGTIVVLHRVLLPILYMQRFGAFAGISFRPSELLNIGYFKNLFFFMTIIQAICMGVIAGQITEGKLISGFKHVAAMLTVGLVVFLLFIFPTKIAFNVEIVPQSVGVGQTITISGQVYFDAQPASGARIEILAPSKETIVVFTNSLGEFSTTITAPVKAGTYSIPLLMTYGSEVYTETRTITVL